jgi:hypothetical protein
LAYDTYKTGKIISLVGVGIHIGTVFYTMASFASAIGSIGFGGSNSDENSIKPQAGFLTGLCFIVGGILYKRSAWNEYNKKFKHKKELSFLPIIQSNKIGVALNF